MKPLCKYTYRMNVLRRWYRGPHGGRDWAVPPGGVRRVVRRVRQVRAHSCATSRSSQTLQLFAGLDRS